MARPPSTAALDRNDVEGWRERALIPVRPTSLVSGLSITGVYAAIRRGDLRARSLAGRTLVEVASIIELIEHAPLFSSAGPRGAALRKERAVSSAQAAA